MLSFQSIRPLVIRALQQLIRIAFFFSARNTLPLKSIRMLHEPFYPKDAAFLKENGIAFITHPRRQEAASYPAPTRLEKGTKDTRVGNLIRPEHWLWVVELEAASIMNLGAIISRRGNIIEECCAPVWWKNNGHSVNQTAALPKIEKLNGKSLILHSESGENFYHWFFDVIPRLKTLECSGKTLDEFDHIIINEVDDPRLDLFCRIFSLERKKLVTLKPSKAKHYQMQSAVVPSCYQHLNHSDPELIEWLQNSHRSLVPSKKNANKRIYIDRSDANGRRVANQFEIDPLLQEFGLEKVKLETLSIEAQIQLFSQASLVVGSHGAGLINLIWCQQGTQVIELSNTEWHNPEYYYISHNAGLYYSEVVCDLAEGTSTGTKADF